MTRVLHLLFEGYVAVARSCGKLPSVIKCQRDGVGGGLVHHV
jgi:hypothetical protein